MSQVYHKRGDTLSFQCVWNDSAGNPVNISGYTITSQVRAVSFVDDLTVTVTNPTLGQFTLSATAADTATWPLTTSAQSRVFCDVQFVLSGVVTSSETFQIIVVEDITQ